VGAGSNGGQASAQAAGNGQATTATTGKCGGSTPPTTGQGGQGSTTTTGKGANNPTTTTTRKGKGGKGGKGSTTTTIAGGNNGPTTSTTVQNGTVSPNTSTGGGSNGPADPGSNPIQVQQIPDSQSPDPGPAAGPEAAVDPGSVNGQPIDMAPGGPIGPTGADAPLAVPGGGRSVLPIFGDLFPGGTAKATASRSGRVQELASSPLVTGRAGSAQTQSDAVSRSLPGVQASATELAFPARIISTPSVFPINHRDPLAAAALVLLAGVSRELFKAWRRQATRVWPG
jgi:hypothetical protein